MPELLDIVGLPGLRADSLGNYLATLGLLKAATGAWPRVRGFWGSDHFVLAAAGLDGEKLRSWLLNRWEPTPYERWWKGQKGVARARSWEPDLGRVRLLDAHIVPKGNRNLYNDILGTGGNVGKRDFAAVVEQCRKLVKQPGSAAWLGHSLFGENGVELPLLPSTGTWFPEANKAFNSGLKVAREGQLSPWSFLLALEGALLLQGGAARRLGARSRPYATFPFISEAAPPDTAGQLGAERSEFWAPLWERPATLDEVRWLLRRGQARVGQRSARASYDFAVAALTAGTQAGVDGFVRFSLRQTTSGNTYEALPERRLEVNSRPDRARQSALVRIANWIAKLPADQGGQNEMYFGLQGPVNRALMELAQEPDKPERWQDLLRAITNVQFRVDRNRNWRERTGVALPVLPESLFSQAWPDGRVPREIEIAACIASVRSGAYGLSHNLFSLDPDRPGRFSQERSASAVWHEGAPERVLADVLERRLLDAEPRGEPAVLRPPLRGARPCSSDLVEAFVSQRIDADAVVVWVPPLSLIAWKKRDGPDAVGEPHGSAEFLLQGFFRPLLTPSWIVLRKLTDPIKPDAIRARTLVRLIRAGSWQAAFDLAGRCYRACGLGMVQPPDDIDVSGDRIAAALLIPMARNDTRAVFRRWIVTRKDRTS